MFLFRNVYLTISRDNLGRARFVLVKANRFEFPILMLVGGVG